MGDTPLKTCAVLPQDSNKVGMRIALVKKHRLTEVAGQFQLPMEGFLLDGARREVAIVVEPAFADGNDLRRSCELAQLGQQLIAQLACVVRMNARRREQPAGVSLSQRYGSVRARAGAASHYHLEHAGARGTCNHLVTIGVEAVVGEI